MSEATEGVNPLKAREGTKQRKAMVRSIVKATKAPHGVATIEAKDPARALRILERMAAGDPLKRIAREEGTSLDTIWRMRRSHATTIDQRKELVANDALDAMDQARALQTEKFNELINDPEALKKVNLRDIAQTYALYSDKFFQATEGTRITVEHKIGAVSIDDALREIAEAKKRLRDTSVEVNVTPAEEADGKGKKT